MANLLFTILGVAVAFLGLSLLVLVHELGHFIAAKRAGVGVKEFSLGFGKKLWGFKKGETEYKVCAIPLGGYVNMMGLESDKSDDPSKNYNNKSKLTRLQILAAGVVFNFIFAIMMLTLVNMHGVKQYKLNLNTIPDTPAASVLQTGDEIRSVNGVEVKNWEEVTAALRKSEGQPIRLTVIRNGEEKRVSIKPVKVEGEDEFGAKVERWVIGIAPTGEVFLAPGMPLPEAFLESAKTCGNAYVLTYVFIGKIVTKKAKAEKGLGGPVLIVSLMSGAAKDGFFSFLTLLAVVSLCLGIMNSLPIPVLDGGHIMFLGLEAVRGKPLKKETMNVIQSLFFWLLILLMLFATYLDIGRLLGR
ncbi:MAG: M50 family metallopeptidase [Nanoarchaeota archaeon]|nr:M50 family metallopeptidase [Nanoarchaeota archaeon]